MTGFDVMRCSGNVFFPEAGLGIRHNGGSGMLCHYEADCLCMTSKDTFRRIAQVRGLHNRFGQFKWLWELRLANYPGQLSMKDIAEITGYNRETIRRWVSDDRIAYVEVGKKYIISKDELRSFLRCKFFGNITRKSAVHLRLVAYSCANAYKQEKGSEN